MRIVLAAAMCGFFVAGCAKDADQVGATYVSPIAYESYNCSELIDEAQSMSSRAARAAGVQDQRATNDKVAMGVGLIIFWPALLFTKGNDENTARLASLKGQIEAVEQASIKKKCGIAFQRSPSPPPPSSSSAISIYAEPK